MAERKVFTSESVSMGHPDKVCDQISDAVVDACLKVDPSSRVACETLATTGTVIVAGEITTAAELDYQELVRSTIRDIGYTDPTLGFSHDSCGVGVYVHRQSPDINRGVDKKDKSDQGAGDQGIMFGFACDETPELMPAPIMWAHKLVNLLAEDRKKGREKWLRPDAKSQVTVEYDDQDRPIRIDTVLVSTQHTADAKNKAITDYVRSSLAARALPKHLIDKKTKWFVNPTGRFVIGGPHGDSGLTGRKIIVDTYGGMGRHGGGAFSGKDPSKVDRSAAYACRWVAKNIVKAGLARRCEVQVSYAIGVAQPLSVRVMTGGTGKVPDGVIEALVRKHFDLRPRAIIESLDLLRPIYRLTASGGHFGRALPEFKWEATDRADALRKDAGI